MKICTQSALVVVLLRHDRQQYFVCTGFMYLCFVLFIRNNLNNKRAFSFDSSSDVFGILFITV